MHNINVWELESNLEGMDMSLPCRLCREPALGISKFCAVCMWNNFYEMKRHIYPVSIKDIEEKWKK